MNEIEKREKEKAIDGINFFEILFMGEMLVFVYTVQQVLK